MNPQLYLLLVLNVLTFHHSVGSNDCAPNESCTVKRWVVTDCDPCCQMSAAQTSAVQKRVICCPLSAGGDLTLCVNMCSFSPSQIEQRGDCVGLCSLNCTGGFHFRATSTSTTTTTTTTTTTPTTMTSTTTTSTTASTTTPTTTPTTTTTTSQTMPTTTDNGLRVMYLSPTTTSPTPKHCNYHNNPKKGTMKNAPMMISLALAGAVVGPIITLLMFWLLKWRKGKVTPDPRTPVKRPPASGPVYEPTYDKNIDRQGFNIRNDNHRTGHSKRLSGLGDNLKF